ncbi:MAG: hypothetical protein NC910_00720 [Candidatus Omnitrophica bacterium]|nr:hypothetical protein [Candidatus Omnitrophota bacterium]
MNPLKTELDALRHAAVLFTHLPRRILSVRGKDRVSFLHNLVSHDIKGLRHGQGEPACLLDRQGKIVCAFLVHLCEEEILLETSPDQFPSLQEGLKKYLVSESVEISEAAGEISVICLHGPRALDRLRKIWPGSVWPEKELAHTPGPGQSGITRTVRWDLFRVPGYCLWTQPVDRQRLLKMFQTGPSPILTAGPETFETARIEAGVPWPGRELTSGVILNELGDEKWMSFTKGCYVGQEIVARIKYRAHPPRLLKGFRLSGTTPPSTPSEILSDSKPAGLLTSACWSPTADSVIGLGFLNHGAPEDGLSVKENGRLMEAVVCNLPIVNA